MPMNVDHYQSGGEVCTVECEAFAVVCLHFRHNIRFHISPLILLLFVCLFFFVCLLKCLFCNVFEVKRLYLFDVYLCFFFF